jgi:hypothetical protein
MRLSKAASELCVATATASAVAASMPPRAKVHRSITVKRTYREVSAGPEMESLARLRGAWCVHCAWHTSSPSAIVLHASGFAPGLAPGLAFRRWLGPRNDAGDIRILVRSERGPVGLPPLSLVPAFGFLLLALLASDFFLTLFEGIRSRSHFRRLFCLSAVKKRGIRTVSGWPCQETYQESYQESYQDR